MCRYATLESNWDKHKPELSDQENLDAFNSFTPGYPYRTDVNMDEVVPDACPNKPKVHSSDTARPRCDEGLRHTPQRCCLNSRS